MALTRSAMDAPARRLCRFGYQIGPTVREARAFSAKQTGRRAAWQGIILQMTTITKRPWRRRGLLTVKFYFAKHSPTCDLQSGERPRNGHLHPEIEATNSPWHKSGRAEIVGFEPRDPHPPA
jgi:hypothetical protein